MVRCSAPIAALGAAIPSGGHGSVDARGPVHGRWRPSWRVGGTASMASPRRQRAERAAKDRRKCEDRDARETRGVMRQQRPATKEVSLMQRPKMLVAMIAMAVLSLGIGVPAAAAGNGARVCRPRPPVPQAIRVSWAASSAVRLSEACGRSTRERAVASTSSASPPTAITMLTRAIGSSRSRPIPATCRFWRPCSSRRSLATSCSPMTGASRCSLAQAGCGT